MRVVLWSFSEIKEDLEYDGWYRKICRMKYNICSIHHFKRDIDMHQNQEEFCKLMKKRFNRLNKGIHKSNTIGIFCNRQDREGKFVKFLKKFAVLYPEKIHINKCV